MGVSAFSPFLGQRQKVRLVHLVQEVDGFLPIVIPVDNQVKDIPSFCRERDELLARLGAAANVVNQGQVPVRGQGSAVPAACKLFQQGGKFLPVQGKGEAVAAVFAYRQIVRMDISLPLRQEDLDPFPFRSGHFHLRSVGKLGESLVVKPCPGTDI